MPPDLTPRQRELYEAICDFIRDHGYSPTHRQLAGALACKHNSIQELLEQLENKGYVSRAPGVSRSLRLLGLDISNTRKIA